MNKPIGLHPDSFKAYVQAFYQAKINPEHSAGGGRRIMQIIGEAPASAGFHRRDGYFKYTNAAGVIVTSPYGAAIDTRSRDLSTAECERLWKALIKNGFAAWWRHTGSFADNQHFHMFYLGIFVKPELRAQAKDFFRRRSGLVGHRPDPFLVANLDEATEQKGRALFLKHNEY